ncbi:MAG TPA: VWA domain-containing protein [Bryobacteraceae bacterium]|nr:VWA domain-containing protein [Bryobacteraceae bacterium]
MGRIFTAFLVCAFGAAGQQIGQNASAPAGGTATFQSSTQLVVETVAVKDKSGKPIEGLTAKDFTVTEDGAPQSIRFFEYQKLPDPPQELPAAKPPHRIPNPYKKYPRSQITAEQPGNVRYVNRRLLALYFDMSAMQVPEQLRAFDAAERFIQTQMTPADLVAVLMFAQGSVQVLQDFTDDRDRLLRVVDTLVAGEDQDSGDTTNDAATADSGAAFGQDDSEFNIFNTDRQLSALQTAAHMLGLLNEKKALLYFGSWLRLNGTDNQAQLHATINAAIRAGVSLWPIDARGLVAQAPLGDATKGSPGGIGMFTGASAMAVTTNFQRSQDTLYALASDTGGKALFDYNDLTRGILQAEKSFSSYYILGYYTINAALDGKFRRIKISLNGAGASLDYRQGYYAGKRFSKFSAADKERQLEDALMLGDPITELTIAMELDYFQLNRAEYFVPLTVKIPGRELALAKRRGAEHTLLDFIGEVKDDYGTTMQNVRDKEDIKLSDATAQELARHPIEYSTGFTLLPGKYKIKFLARDSETGRIGTYETAFVIPDLNKEVKRIPISTVVLSSQRVDLRDALYNAAKKQGENTNPLVEGGQKLVPSVTRVFRKSGDLYVYLQTYQPDTPTVEPMVAFLTFYRGQAKAFETPPLPVTQGWNNRLKTMPLRFTVPLGQLAAGEYTCQVTVLAPQARKAAFWQGQVMVVP